MKWTVLLFVNIPFSLMAQNVGVGTNNPQQKLHVAGNIRVDALSGSSGVLKYDANGDLVSLPNSSNAKHVLLGNGTWGNVNGTVPLGSMVATTKYIDTALLNNGYSLSGYLTNFIEFTTGSFTVPANSWLVTYVEGDVTKYTPPSVGAEDIFYWYNGEMFFFANNKFYAYNPVTDNWRFVMDNPTTYKASVSAKSVWTGTEIIVWGGNFSVATDNGFRYNPATNVFTAIPTTAQPTARRDFAIHFINNRLVIWGGFSGGVDVNTGGILNLTTNTWTNLNTTGAPAGRVGFSSVTNTNQNTMMIWGGANFSPSFFYNDGAVFNPVTNSWTPITAVNAPVARWFHTAVWSGTEMIVHGGDAGAGFFNSGGRYNPATNTWTAVSASQSPVRRNHASIWTGTKMLLHGGYSSNLSSAESDSYLYNPATNIWESAGLSGTKKAFHKLVMGNNIILAFGGITLIPDGDEVFGSPLGSRYFLTSTTATSTTLFRYNKLYLYRRIN